MVSFAFPLTNFLKVFAFPRLFFGVYVLFNLLNALLKLLYVLLILLSILILFISCCKFFALNIFLFFGLIIIILLFNLFK